MTNEEEKAARCCEVSSQLLAACPPINKCLHLLILKDMKKLFRPAGSRETNIPAIDVAVGNSDLLMSDIQMRLKSNCMPLHRRIKADREFGVNLDVYPYESTFDDDSDVEAQNIDVQADFRRSKWTTYAEACCDNSSLVKQSVEPPVKQSEEPPAAAGGEIVPTATDGGSSAE